jgi:hypothetical protein
LKLPTLIHKIPHGITESPSGGTVPWTERWRSLANNHRNEHLIRNFTVWRIFSEDFDAKHPERPDVGRSRSQNIGAVGYELWGSPSYTPISRGLGDEALIRTDQWNAAN